MEDYRFRHGGSRVVCSLGLLYSQASGLLLERSGADCSTDAGQVIRPEGGWQLADVTIIYTVSRPGGEDTVRLQVQT